MSKLKKRQSMSDIVTNPFGRKLKVLVVPSDRTGVGYSDFLLI